MLAKSAYILNVDFILFSTYSKDLRPTSPIHPLRSYLIILENVLGVKPPRYVTDQTDLDFYLAFPNPLNSLEEEYRIYPFMITGPCSPLFSSAIFLTAFNTPKEFEDANGTDFSFLGA